MLSQNCIIQNLINLRKKIVDAGDSEVSVQLNFQSSNKFDNKFLPNTHTGVTIKIN